MNRRWLPGGTCTTMAPTWQLSAVAGTSLDALYTKMRHTFSSPAARSTALIRSGSFVTTWAAVSLGALMDSRRGAYWVVVHTGAP